MTGTTTGPWVPSAVRRTASIVAVLAVLAGCGDSDDAAPAASTTEATTTSTSTTSAPTTTSPPDQPAEVRVGEHDALRTFLRSPDWLTADANHVYVKLDSGSVERIDPATGVVLASAEITGRGGVAGSGCQGIGVGFDSVWSCHGTDVVRFSTDPFEEISRIPAGKATSQGQLATGFDRVWVLQGDGSTVAGIDPETEQVSEPIELPIRGTDLAVGADGVWIISSLDDAVVVVDPVDGTVRHRIDVNEPVSLSIVGDAAWVGGTDAVHRIDQASGTISSTMAGGTGRSGALAVDETGIWVRRGTEVRRVDADSGADTETFTLDLSENSPGHMLVAFGALWTTGSEDSALFRIALA